MTNEEIEIRKEILGRYLKGEDTKSINKDFIVTIDSIESTYLATAWMSCKNSFAGEVEIKRKPKTIRIGEFDVPEPLKVRPDYLEEYYVPNIFSNVMFERYVWSDDNISIKALFNGIVHLTADAAIQHAKALQSLTAKGK